MADVDITETTLFKDLIFFVSATDLSVRLIHFAITEPLNRAYCLVQTLLSSVRLLPLQHDSRLFLQQMRDAIVF